MEAVLGVNEKEKYIRINMAKRKKKTHNEYSQKKREIHIKELLDMPFSWSSTLLLGVGGVWGG